MRARLLCTLGLVILILILVDVKLFLCRRDSSWGLASSPAEQSGMRAFAVSDVAAVLLTDLREEPWLVVGLWSTPRLPQWGEWGVEYVRALASPTGVFGAYGDCEYESLADSQSPTGVAFQLARCRQDPICEPRHWVTKQSFETAAQVFAAPELLQATHVYLRGTAGRETRQLAAGAIGVPLKNLSPYLSSAGSATNLHFDGPPGILAQTEGEKDVSLFAPGTMPLQAPKGSPCYRRSRHDGRECPDGAAYRVRLQPNWGVYIPALWAHHVTSLSAETLGAVWRFF